MTDKITISGHEQALDETSLKYMWKLAAPMIVTNISFTVMQFVDRSMVAELGKESLAAILPAGFVSFLPASFALGVMMSVNTFVSQSLGRGEKKDCSNYCWQAIYMGLIYTCVALAIFWPSAPLIFRMMKQPADVIGMEVTYMRIMLYTQFLIVFVWASSQFFMGIHRPVITMYAAIVGQAVNITANYVLIFGRFGAPEMGIAGAGWGTFIGISVGAAVRMAAFLGSRLNREFYTRGALNIDFGKMGDLIKIGFPAGIGFMVNIAFLGVILFGLVGSFGTESLAATSAVFACVNVSVMPVVGISTALTAAVGKSIGKGRKDLAVKQTSLALKMAICYMLFMGICFFLFRHGIMNYWAKGDGRVIEVGMNLLICAAIFQVFDAAVITYNGALRGAGDTVWLAAISAVGSILVLGLGGLMMVLFFPELGAIGPWIALTGNIMLVGVANRWRFKSNHWMRIDLFRRRPVGVAVEVEGVVE